MDRLEWNDHIATRVAPHGRRCQALFAAMTAVGMTAALASVGPQAMASTAGPVAGLRQVNSGSKPITLTVADYWGAPPASQEFPALIKRYEAIHRNVHIVESSVPQSNFVSKVLEEAAGGNTPDVIVGDNPDTPDFTKAGILAPITQDMARAGLKVSSFYPGPMQAASWKGQIYGLPVGNNVELLYYNKTLLAKAGVAVPKTWAQLQAAAKRLTDKPKNVYGFAASGYAGEETTWDWETYLWELGGSLAKINSPAGIKSLEFFTGFVKDGTSPQAELTTSFVQEMATLFSEGRFALGQMGSWNLSVVAQDAAKTGLKWGVTVLPVPRAGQHPVVPFGGENFAVGKTDKAHEAAAWNFIDWLFQPKRIGPFDYGLSYLPTLKAAVPTFLKLHPIYTAVAAEMAHSESRTAQLAYNYPQASQDIWTEMASIMDGRASAVSAASRLTSEVSPLVVFK